MRRLVTGEDEHGRSGVILDGAPSRIIQVDGPVAGQPRGIKDIAEVPESVPEGALVTAELWATRGKAACSAGDPMLGFAASDFNHFDPGDTRLRLTKFSPGLHVQPHRTNTIDQIVVMAGEADLILDKDEVHLEQGDVVILQAVTHAWRAGPSGFTMAISKIALD